MTDKNTAAALKAHRAALEELDQWAARLADATARRDELANEPALTPGAPDQIDAAMNARAEHANRVREADELVTLIEQGKAAAEQRERAAARKIAQAQADAMAADVEKVRADYQARRDAVTTALAAIGFRDDSTLVDTLVNNNNGARAERDRVDGLERQHAALEAAARGEDLADTLPADYVPDILSPGGALESPNARTRADEITAALEWAMGRLTDYLTVLRPTPAMVKLEGYLAGPADQVPAGVVDACNDARSRVARIEALRQRRPIPLTPDALDDWDYDRRVYACGGWVDPKAYEIAADVIDRDLKARILKAAS